MVDSLFGKKEITPQEEYYKILTDRLNTDVFNDLYEIKHERDYLFNLYLPSLDESFELYAGGTIDHEVTYIKGVKFPFDNNNYAYNDIAFFNLEEIFIIIPQKWFYIKLIYQNTIMRREILILYNNQ